MTIAPEHRSGFLTRLAPPDRPGAVDLVLDLYRAGAGAGASWQRNEWSIAMEHAASAVTDAALAALAFASDRDRPIGDRGRVLVACVEGEWHALPARMLAEALRDDGFDVTFLGASSPAEEIARYAETLQPVAVALSCAVSLSLMATRRCIDAVHAAGYPVIVGGAAFDAEGRRGAALGADACATSTTSAGAVIDGWRHDVPELRAAPPIPDVVLALDAERDALVAIAYDDLAERFAPMQSYTEQQRVRTYEDLQYIAVFAGAALLADDPMVFDEFVVWLLDVLGARSVPAVALALGLGALARHIDAPEILELLRRGAELSGHPEMVPTP